MAERISLAEAYNNKDVITQIAILKDKLDSIPDADLTNVVLKTGDQIIDGEKTFNDPIVANGGVVFANNGIHVNGTLEVDGDIIQNGSAYETHAEQVFTKNDLIVTREDAIGGIAAGQLSGIRVKKYDGVSDLNLGVDSGGIMRVGDLGSEQPLATREEAANMTSGAVVKWDGVNNRMIAPASNIGSDSLPVKVINGELVPVANSLVVQAESVSSGVAEIRIMKYGKVVTVTITQYNLSPGETTLNIPNLPKTFGYEGSPLVTATNNHGGGVFIGSGNTTELKLVNSTGTAQGVWGTLTYITSD